MHHHMKEVLITARLELRALEKKRAFFFFFFPEYMAEEAALDLGISGNTFLGRCYVHT